MDAVSDPFWDALADGRFLFPSCGDCGEPFFPPAPVCPRCHAPDVEWIESDAVGTLYAVTRQHRTAPGIPSPLVLGVVELDEGPRLLTRVQTEYDDLEIGTRLRLEPCEYEGAVDRGRLSEYPFFEAHPVE